MTSSVKKSKVKKKFIGKIYDFLNENKKRLIVIFIIISLGLLIKSRIKTKKYNVKDTKTIKSYLQILPIEVKDNIFLRLDYSSLQKTRDLQSSYIRKLTKYNNIKDAIRSNNYNNIKWLISKGSQLSSPLINLAVSIGDLKVIKLLREYGCPWDNYNTFMVAAVRGDIDIMNWLKKNGCPINKILVRNILVSKKPHVIKWLIKNKLQ